MNPGTQTSGLPTDPPGGAAGSTGPDLTGQTLGDFHILRRLGQGGMGQVYLAEQLALKRKVALKILRADVAANPTSLQRFKAEAEAVGRVTHANIVQVYTFGESGGQHYMALEYVEGRNLREYLTRKGPPEVLLALSIMRQVAAALQRASELGIIHRDIKPENILLTRKGEVKVADFGLSRCLAEDQQPLNLTQSGVTMGTPLYMSPEQVEGKPVDPRTDVYSFGVTCYHMLAGEPPFRGNNAFAVARQHVSAEPAPLTGIRPDLPAELCAIVHKMMAKDPAQRYQTGRDLLKDLVRLRESLSGVMAGQQTQGISLGSQPVPLPAETAPSMKMQAPLPRRRWLPAAVIASLVVAAAGGAALAWFRNRAEEPLPGPAAADVGAVEAMFSPEKREQFLKMAVEQYANPKDRNGTLLGLGHCVELGLLYLEQWRLDEAESFFKGLTENPHKVEEYTLLGKMGTAIVLGLRNKAKESVALFKEAAGSPKSEFRRHPVLWTNVPLRQWVRKALEYDAANLKQEKQDLPRELKYLIEPPAGPRAGGDKPPIKTP